MATLDSGSAKVHSMSTMLSTPCDTAFEELSWRADGLCAQTDPDAFLPSQGESARDAKSICAGCGVGQSCLVRHRQGRAVRDLGRALGAGTQAD